MSTSMTSMGRKRYHHGDLPAALLEAAREMIEEDGSVEAFSLREAARRVGVDPAACYRHFGSRDELLDALARKGFEQMAASMERAAARAADPADAVAALGYVYVGFARSHAPEFRTMFTRTGVSARNPELRGAPEGGRSPYEILAATVSQWRPRASAEKVEEIAHVLWAGIHGVAVLIVTGAWAVPKTRQKQYVDAMIDALIAGTRSQ